MWGFFVGGVCVCERGGEGKGGVFCFVLFLFKTELVCIHGIKNIFANPQLKFGGYRTLEKYCDLWFLITYGNTIALF